MNEEDEFQKRMKRLQVASSLSVLGFLWLATMFANCGNDVLGWITFFIAILLAVTMLIVAIVSGKLSR